MVAEVGEDLFSYVLLVPDANGQGFHAAHEHPARVGIGHASEEMAVFANARHGVGLAARSPGDEVAVPADVFRRRVHQHVSAVLQGPLEDGAEVGVVNPHNHAVVFGLVLPCPIGRGADAVDLHRGVGRGFQVDHPGFASPLAF